MAFLKVKNILKLSLVSFCFNSLAAAAATTTAPAIKSFPSCPRPTDFSVGKGVAAYETCLGRQEKFCDQNEKLPVCKKFLAPKNEVLRTGPGSDVAAACAIQKDGSYKCEQERVRFLVPEEVIQPLSSPTGLPNIDEDGTVSPATAATPGGTPAAGASTGAGGQTPAAGAPTQPPPFIPPPPPGFNPNK